MQKPRLMVAAAAALTWTSCRPDLLTSGSLVTSARILAVRGDPPESMPGHAVTYRVLLADPQNPDPMAAYDWSFCVAPKPLTENDAVSVACLSGDTSARAPIAEAAPTVTATTPIDACQHFGPDPPPGMFRPRDPDVTGGYYQPVIVDRTPETAIALERILCNLALAPTDVANAYRMGYSANQNPKIRGLTASIGGQAVALERLPPDTKIDLLVEWDPSSKESFLLFDLASASLVSREEALTVSWFASSGTLDLARTGREAGDETPNAADTWTTPSATGPVLLWIVLRDDRGGVDFAAYPATIVD
jgi:hypothetical protein